MDPNDWSKYDVAYVAVGIVAGTILIVLIFIMFWLCKSRQRHLEKLERRSSIRSSIRSASSRSLGGSSTFGSSDLAYRRKMLSDEKLAVTKPVQLIEVKQPNGSVDSIAKSGGGASSRFGSSQLNSSVEDDRSYEVFEARNNQVINILRPNIVCIHWV